MNYFGSNSLKVLFWKHSRRKKVFSGDKLRFRGNKAWKWGLVHILPLLADKVNGLGYHFWSQRKKTPSTL
jgi:hypothetical protein